MDSWQAANKGEGKEDNNPIPSSYPITGGGAKINIQYI